MANRSYREPSKLVDQTAFSVIGAAIEVHRHLGPGLLEAAYERALVIELHDRGMRVASQVVFPIRFKGHDVAESRLDLIVEDVLLVELKSVEALTRLHLAQTVSYLHVAQLDLALLINFNVLVLRDGIRRVISSDRWSPPTDSERR